MIDPYIRRAMVVRIIDGDSLVLEIDLGFSVLIKQVVRLAHIDAPELVGASKKAGTTAKIYLQNLLPSYSSVLVQTVKPREKYGRYLATVFLDDGVCLNDLLVKEGHAVVWPAIVKAPVPDAVETEGGSTD